MSSSSVNEHHHGGRMPKAMLRVLRLEVAASNVAAGLLDPIPRRWKTVAGLAVVDEHVRRRLEPSITVPVIARRWACSINTAMPRRGDEHDAPSRSLAGRDTELWRLSEASSTGWNSYDDADGWTRDSLPGTSPCRRTKTRLPGCFPLAGNWNQ